MAGFFEELKRRKVIRVFVAYIVASWLLLQVADVLSNVLALPDWAPKLVFFLLVVGLVPALILAWAYEITPDGIKTDSESRGEPPAPGRGGFLPVASIGFLAAVIGAGLFWLSGADDRWVRDEGIPEVERQMATGSFQGAFEAALEIEARQAGSASLEGYWREFSWKTNFPSAPEGATVYRRNYDDTETEWQELGWTPLYDVRVPRGLSVIRFELDDHEPVTRLIGGLAGSSNRLPRTGDDTHNNYNTHIVDVTFDPVGSIGPNEARVPGMSVSIDGYEVRMADFFIDRYEVTNREYQAFVNAGGYENEDYWEHEFVRDGQTLNFEAAMKVYVDTTGRPGPSNWTGSAYPEGMADHPVGGISWYEAAAYARFAKRDLPTVHHWRRAYARASLSWELAHSNLDTGRSAPVGQYRGIGWVGTLDMLGNVREWCANEVGDQRAILGGGWNDAPYMAGNSVDSPGTLPPFDRSPENGVRLTRLNGEQDARNLLAQAIESRQPIQPATPVSDEVFSALLANFDYSSGPMNAVVEETTEMRGFVRHRISFDIDESGDRMHVYLFLPGDEVARYPVMFYWSSSHGFYLTDIEQFRLHLDFMLKRGWAVAMPILDHTFDRGTGRFPDMSDIEYRDQNVRWVREVRRTVDYLETRSDLDMDKLVMYGFSWGGRVAALALAVDDRFKVAVLNQAGLSSWNSSNVAVEHYLPRVTQPVLQINGRFDQDYRLDDSAKPFFELLGSEQKKHVVSDTGHFATMQTVIGETLAWLDLHAPD